MAGARKNGRRLLHTALLLAILGVALGQTHRVTQKAGSLSVAYLAGSDPWKYVWGVDQNTAWLWGGGAGVNPVYVSYLLFDISAFAPTPARFCATGSPKFHISSHVIAGDWFCTSNINAYSYPNGIVTEVPPSTWTTSSITYTNQPPLTSNLGRAVSTAYTATTGLWNYVPISATMLNAAVRQSTVNMSLRHYINDAFIVCTGTLGAGASLAPYIAFDYLTCDVNAQCVNNACVCNSPYVGTGTSCTIPTCPATTMGNANFPLTNNGVTATGTCAATFGGAPTSKCTTGSWGALGGTACTKLQCPTSTDNVGGATFSPVNAGTTGTGVCNSGWSGSATRACNNNGQWAATATTSCTRIVCGATTKDNAALPQTNSLTTATGSCIAGYTGTPQATCSASGTWSAVSPGCTLRVCAQVNDAANNVVWPATNAFASATGICASGFAGVTTRPCTSSGTFGTVSGSCVQLKCAAGSYDNAGWGLTNAGSTATGSCASGYSGSPKRDCLLTGEWSSSVSTPCTRNLCGAATNNDAVWPGNTPSNTVAVGTCLPGFSGTPSRECTAGGTWGAISNPCTQIYCPATQLDNADWPLTPAGSSSVSAACVSGYDGSAVRSCDVYGNWAPVTTACVRKQCAGLTEANAVWGTTNSLTQASGSCVAGYSGNPVRECSADGVFGPIINACAAIMCPPRSEQRATWSTSTAGSADVVGECDEGWEGAPTRSCSMAGSWGTIGGTACVQRKCPATNDSTALAHWNEAPAGDMFILGECYPNTSGQPRRSCFYNGTWSEVTNPCSTNPCVALTNDQHANWPKARDVNTVVNGTCVGGYSSTGTPSRLCMNDGKWDTTITNPCTPIFCTKTTPGYLPFNADWPETLQAGYSTSGTCAAGYTGTTTRSCSLAGQWNTPSPLCSQIVCPSIPDDGAHASWSSTAAGVTATGTCLGGYEGTPQRECSITGQWGAVSSPCGPKKCGARSDGNADWPETLGGVTVSGACQSGFAGVVTRTCSSDGVWGQISGSCDALACPAVTNNNVIWPVTSSGSFAVGECAVGYGPSSPSPSRFCTASATWDAPTGSCTRRRCAAGTYQSAAWPLVDSMTDDVRGTCIEGWQGVPLRNCSADGTYSSTVSNPCTRITCPAVDDGASGSWDSTDSGTPNVPGTCPAGSTGSPMRDCRSDGSWTGIVGSCAVLTCAPQSLDHVNWPSTPAGGVAAGVCDTGYAGSPSRSCGLDGSWGAVSNPCVALQCAALEEENADWPQSAALSSPVHGTCIPGYIGSPTRGCDATGVWGPIYSPCTAVMCPAGLADNANWTETRAGDEGYGECVSGLTGVPRRACLMSGAWNTTVVDPCQIKYDNCASESLDGMFFPEAEPGSTSVGSCGYGFGESPAGPPTRECLENGTWEESYSNACVYVPISSSDAVYNLTLVSKTSTDVTLSWSAVNITVNSTFRAEFSLGSQNYVIANSNSAVGFTETSIVIRGLSPNTFYYFRITMGDRYWGYNDASGSIISTTTFISPATGLRLEESTTSSLKLSWTPSALAEFYAVYTRAVGVSRAVTDGFDLYAQVDSSAGSIEVTDLESGRSYEVLVLAGKGNETEQVGARMVLTTKSSTDSVVEDPGLGESGIVIAGASAAGVVVLIVVLVVVVVVIRRRQKETLKQLNEFGGADAMEAMHAYRNTLAHSRSSMRHAESTTHLWQADKTVVNTAMEVALPGFLLVDYATTVQPGELVGSDAGDTEYHATIIDPHVSTRVGFSRVVMRDYNDVAQLTVSENNARFHREVSIMWSLSFHPNIVRILAYTDEPRTVMTRAFHFDLSRFIQATQRPMPSDQLHQLAMNISSAVSAIHSFAIAHRNIQSANVFLLEPTSESPLYTAVLGGFSQSRSADDGIAYVPPQILNVRYTAPEVLQAAQDGSTLDHGITTELASDVYSLGVVMHELASGNSPWSAQTDDSVRNAVLSGKSLVPEALDETVLQLTLSSIVQAALMFEPAGRPSSSLISAKLASINE